MTNKNGYDSFKWLAVLNDTSFMRNQSNGFKQNLKKGNLELARMPAPNRNSGKREKRYDVTGSDCETSVPRLGISVTWHRSLVLGTCYFSYGFYSRVLALVCAVFECLLFFSFLQRWNLKILSKQTKLRVIWKINLKQSRKVVF